MDDGFAVMTDTDDLLRQAEAWHARLMAPDCSAAEREAFAAWCRLSPAHAQARASTDRLLAGVERLAASDLRMQRLMQRARTPVAASAPGWRGGRWPLALAASLLVATALGLWWGPELLRPAAPTVAYTSGAELGRTVALEDGSQLQLDIASRVDTRFDRRQRDLALTQGRALFDVAHDAQRPFVVRAGDGRVTAVGTRFQVQREQGRVTITLVEGRIVVDRDPGQGAALRLADLRPGDQVSWSEHAAPDWTRSATDAETVLGWTRGRLIFRGTPLADVVAEVNRYSSRKLVLHDPAIATLPVHGNFVAGDAGRVVTALGAVLPVRVEDQDGALVLYAR